jgi:SAM-dependent methyltransferase
MATWREVWEARKLSSGEGSTLAALMAADGLDTGFGSAPEEPWRAFVRDSAATLGITTSSSIFEVGCGAGAYLYDLAQQGCTVAGSDISSAQIEHVRRAIPGGVFQVEEAHRLDVTEAFDFVVATGVFQYFPSLDYAQEVLRRMAAKARQGIAVLDIPDADTNDAAMEFRRGSMGEEEYAQRYAGLDHLYIDRSWLESQLPQLGFERWRLEGQSIAGYGNSAFRFNLFAWK